MTDEKLDNGNSARSGTSSHSQAPLRLRRSFLLAATMIAVGGCVTVRPGRLDPLREEADELVRGLEQGLRRGGWMSVERYFSDDHHSTLTDIRERLDDRRRREFAADWLLRVNRVLTQDKRVSVSVRWSHRWNDLKGKPQKREGESELLLQRERGELRILDIRGNML
jgi:hypothetical protein